jgi:hypothetical protein
MEEKEPVDALARRSGWQAHSWRFLAIWALLAAAYSNSFQFGLVLDNASIIGNHASFPRPTLDAAFM